MMQSLEVRRFLSIAVQNGVMIINGTEGRDVIVMQRLNLQTLSVTLNGKTTGPLRAVTKLRVNLLGGNDSLNMSTLSSHHFAITRIYGGSGDDTIVGGMGMDLIYGQAGDDLINGRAGYDRIWGDHGNDNLDSGNEGVIHGGNGDDLLKGAHSLYGGEGNDRLTGVGRAWLAGGRGDDIIIAGGPSYLGGGDGNDQLLGGTSSDTLDGGDGNNTLRGHGGNDSLSAGVGRDVFSGGSGTDTADYSLRDADLALTIDGLANDGAPGEGDLIESDIEDLVGGNGDDLISGSAGDNMIQGGGGSDTIHGGAGNDALFSNLRCTSRGRLLCRAKDEAADELHGDSGNDRIVSYLGPDSLFGGDGDDVLEAIAENRIFGEAGTASQVLNGGAGNDAARSDESDVLSNIEQDLNPPQESDA